ncbi:hypothetical protein MA16_Dca023759 [Dendrobium catenatum]|uniref:Uncharacterized protein n=1 Tax=Dendrobium catenatum TaxID=906689 RepID=A0A2I0XGN6_9ASPA|nr:hypothetical protein MA16_Dca023759 [Dendrobium catenatum]
MLQIRWRRVVDCIRLLSAFISFADPVALDSWCYEASSHLDIFSPFFIHRGWIFWILESKTVDLERTPFRLFGVVDLLFQVFVGTIIVFFLSIGLRKAFVGIVVGYTCTCAHSGSLCLRSTRCGYPQVACACWRKTVVSTTTF